MIFNCEDIHKIRVDTAARRAKMTKEEAKRDLEESAEDGRRAIEEIRRKTKTQARNFAHFCSFRDFARISAQNLNFPKTL